MLLITHHEPTPSTLDPSDCEALIREARKRTRRRRAYGSLALIVVSGLIAAAVALVASYGDGSARAADQRAIGTIPTGRYATLATAGPLAVAPDGALYVADVARHRVLVRSPDGRFRVVAGDGRAGFSGDGGLATHAELSAVTDIAVSPAGDLYIADSGRIRVVDQRGIIRTVAGDGKPLPVVHRRTTANIRAGTHALKAALGSPTAVTSEAPMIAFSLSGQLYISTGVQILRLTSRGTLTPTRAVVTSGPTVLRGPLTGFGPLAVDGHGDIDVAGFNGWSIWQVTPGGTVREIGPGSGARRSGGGYSSLERAPNGRVYAENGPELLQIDGRDLKRIHDFGDSFWLTYFAFGPGGALYADEIPGNSGFEARQQLLKLIHGHQALLWEQPAGAKS